jgi:signal peptidase I
VSWDSAEAEEATGEATGAEPAAADEQGAAGGDRWSSWAAMARETSTGDEATPGPEALAESAEADSEDPWAAFGETEDEAAVGAERPAAADQQNGQSEQDEDDDTWAAIAAASGYDAEDDEAPPPTYKSPLGAYGPREGRQSWLADNFPEHESVPDPVESAFQEFEDADMERDLVLRAFEAHAASDIDGKPEPLEPGAFQTLFGDEADDIVDEMIEPQPEQSFARMRLAPQKRSGRFDDEPDDWVAHADDEAAAVALETDPSAMPFLAATRPHAATDKKTRTWVRELVETGLLALLVFLSVRASFQNFKVDGSSMYPTLEDGQFLIVNKLVYSEVDVDKLGKVVPFVNGGEDSTRHVFHGPERGDIIVLRDPSNPQVDLIKRVVGLPGEKVEILGGVVYIDDQRLEEPYIKSSWGLGGGYGPVVVTDGSYFVMGDNRDNSKDSRSASIGFIAEELIIGRAELSYLPLDAFGLIGSGGPSLSEQDGRPALSSDLRPGETELARAR